TINWRAAWMATALWAVSRKWVALGADVLSDAAAVSLGLTALLLALLTAIALAEHRKRLWPLALAATEKQTSIRSLFEIGE
ncbi:MAG: hypothetical protein ACOCW6_02850, partial [Spirochaetota bacterium]